ncbi:uncharacterized protein LOC131432097 [Malaya genurostris]|uniref:uncharacterized protein LOC131432097 n=1 Tax=Malaya genurostris TaxID=325434 RepID=UPI0026F40924|nr:uncharacterized protein LOC131432097 [Malaya genurostris]
MAEENTKYKKTGTLGGARHGDSFQVHLLMLMYQGAARDESFKNFRLATEWEDAEKFDDAVLSWETDEGKTQNYLFVQAKYKQSSEINEKLFFPVREDEKVKGEFSMYKYLQSFYDIMNNSKFNGGNLDFVIYTNVKLNDSSEWFVEAGIQTTSALKLLGGSGEFLKVQNTDERIMTLLDFSNKDFNDLVKEIENAFRDSNEKIKTDLIKKYNAELDNQVLFVKNGEVRFSDRFKKKENLNPAEMKLYEVVSNGDTMQTMMSTNKQLIDALTSKKQSKSRFRYFEQKYVEKFLEKCIIASNQPNYEALEFQITENFKGMQGSVSDDLYAKMMFVDLRKIIYSWLDCKENDFCDFLKITKFTELSAKVLFTIADLKLENPTNFFKYEMENFRIKFASCSPLGNLIDSNFPMVVYKSTEEGFLTCLKVYQIFQDHKLNYHYLKLTDLRHFEKEINSFKNSNSDVYVLLDDNCPESKISYEFFQSDSISNKIKLIFLTSTEDRAKNFFRNKPFYSIENSKDNMKLLSKDSQEKLSHKSVSFQGVELTLHELLPTENLRTLISDEIVEKLIQEKRIEIGVALPELKLDCYITQIISNMTPSSEYYSMIRQATKSYSEKDFLNHSFQFNTILLSSLPGMGKTTLWMKLAQDAKKLHPTNWILFVRLSDCAKKLEEPNELTNLEDEINLLCEILSIESNFERKLFSKWLQETERKITIFFDGFDELPMKVMEKAISLFRMLEKARIFISTRSHQQEVLEKSIEMKTFDLQPISESDQIVLLKYLLDVSDSLDPTNAFVEKLIESKPMRTLTNTAGTPLIINMLAKIYKPYVNELRKPNENTSLQSLDPENLDFVELFENFTYHSFKRQHRVKHELGDSLLDKENLLYVSYVKLHNYLGLMSLIGKEAMHLIESDEQERTSLEKQADRVDSLIMPKYSNGIPHFIHATIAEFFAAKCLGECLRRMSFETMKQNFYRNDKYFKIDDFKYEDQQIADIYDLYLIVLKHYPFVRKILISYAIENEQILDKLLQMFSLVCPYPFKWYKELICTMSNCDRWYCGIRKFIPDHFNLSSDNFTAKDPNDLPLHAAAVVGSAEFVNLMLNQNALINSRNANRETALDIALKLGDAKIVKLLLDKSAIIGTISMSEILRRSNECAQLFLDRGIPENIQKAIGNDESTYMGEYITLIALKNFTLAKRIISNAVISHNTNRKKSLKFLINENNDSAHEIIKRLLQNMRVLFEGGAKLDSYAFSIAILLGNPVTKECIELLLEYVVDPEKVYNRHFTALHSAAFFNNPECVDMLIQRGFPIMAQDNDGRIPLHIAVEKNAKKVIEILLKHEQATEMLRTSNRWGQTALHLAAESDNCELVNLLIERGASVMAKDTNGKIPLHIAIENEAKKVIEILLKHKQATKMLRTSDFFGQTALNLAIFYGNYEIVNILIEHGASVMAKDKYGRIPLHIAIEKKAKKVVEILLKHEQTTEMLRTSGKYERTALHLAAIYDNYEILNILIEHGASVMAKDEDGRIPLHIAIETNAKKVIEILLEHEQATEMLLTSDESEGNGLHLAAYYKKYELVNILIERGASVMAKNEFGEIPLHIAIEKKAKKVVEILLKHEQATEMLRTSDENGRTALHFAAFYDNYEILNILIEHGASVMAKDEDGRIPLHYAFLGRIWIVVEIFLKHEQASKMMNTPDKDGRTPLRYAEFDKSPWHFSRYIKFFSYMYYDETDENIANKLIELFNQCGLTETLKNFDVEKREEFCNEVRSMVFHDPKTIANTLLKKIWPESANLQNT